MTTTKFTGHIAIAHAESHGLTLNKYGDPTEGARTGLTPDEAREIAREDPALIWIDEAIVAVIGDGGKAPVVWGLGATEAEALDDARDQDSPDSAWDSLGWASVKVDQQVADRIRSGEVDCKSLGIHVRCDRDGRIVDAEVRS